MVVDEGTFIQRRQSVSERNGHTKRVVIIKVRVVFHEDSIVVLILINLNQIIYVSGGHHNTCI